MITQNFGDGSPAHFVFVENKDLDVKLSNKRFVTVQTSFEASQSVTRVSGLPKQPARFGNIQVCTADTAYAKDPVMQKYSAVNFKEIALVQDNLEVWAVANSGIQLNMGREYSHYRVNLLTAQDVILWDKYNWIAPGNLQSPEEAANPGWKW